MADTKPTARAMRAASVIVKLNSDVNKMAGVRNHRCGNWGVDPVADIIDEKTGLPTLQVKIDRLEAEKVELVGALREVAKREGPYSLDQLTHANNTIENMAEIAESALAKHEPKYPREV